MKTVSQPTRGSALLRRGRRSEQGRVYFITFTTHDRKRLFECRDAATRASVAFSEERLWRDSKLICWVLMPDHWHGLVDLGATESLSSLIGRVKAVSARAVKAARHGLGPVWARGYHDHALRSDEEPLAVARYIIGNPLRAGLCGTVGEYPYWNAVWLADAADPI